VLARPAKGAPFKLVELAPGIDLDTLKARTVGHFDS